MGVIGSKSSRGQLIALDNQRQGWHCYRNEQQSQSSNQNSLIHGDVRHHVVDHGIL